MTRSNGPASSRLFSSFDMGQRYLIVVYRGGEEGRSAVGRISERGGMTLVVERQEAAVFVERPDEVLPAGAEGDLIIGTLFESDGDERTRALREQSIERLRRSQGRSSFGDYWGAFICICFHNGGVSIGRDPAAFLPCYYHDTGSSILIGSDVELIAATGLYQPDLDWDMVASHLIHPVERPARTALCGLTELVGGGWLDIGPTGLVVGQSWTPARFLLPEQRIMDEGEAAALVRETVLRCVGAWGRQFDHTLLAVSGGLDSSLVAAALVHSGARVTCVTLATLDPAGDERDYARALTNGLGIDLVECFEDEASVDLTRSDAAYLPRPVAKSFAQSGDRAQAQIARDIGADVFATGGGGDSVFCYLRTLAPLVDRLHVEGPGAGALRTARDLSVLGETSLGNVLWRGAKRAYWSKRPFHWPPTLEFRSAAAIERAPIPVMHPWRAEREGRLLGKVMHVEWILGIKNFLEGYGRELQAPLLAPLMSQPIIELCLRIPTWLWCVGGENRSVARKAFADLLPAPIVQRRSKGTPTSFVIELFDERRSLIREMLFDGLLASQGLLDLAALEPVLAREGGASFEQQAHIMGLVDVEAWARARTTIHQSAG